MTAAAGVAERGLRYATALGFHAVSAEVLPGGVVNHVVRIAGPSSDLVVRFSRDPREDDAFGVEAWCASTVRAAGIATPEVLAVGEVDGRRVSVQRFQPGPRADTDDLAAWRALGAVASAIGRIDVDGAPGSLFTRFGRDLDRAWRAHLDYNLAALTPDDPLIDLAVYPRGVQELLRDPLQRLRARSLRQGLAHGDLSVRNLIRDHTGGYVVVDWGNASVGPTPWTDLELVHRWWSSDDQVSRVSRDAWAAVLEGCGADPVEALSIVREMAVLQALDVVRWALERRPERLPDIVPASRATLRRSVADRAGGHPAATPRCDVVCSSSSAEGRVR